METMKQKRIFVPTDGAETWKRFLADPEKHWQPGFSAMSTALSWENADGLPVEIRAVFSNSDETGLRDARLALAIPEYKFVELEGGTRPSQKDVFALLTSSEGLISMVVEGKGREDFDVTLDQWQQKTSERGYQVRIAHILQSIGLSGPLPGQIRYQLLHRTASAVIEAHRFHARYAVVVVQSFVDDDRENHFSDFASFLNLYGRKANKGALIHLNNNPGCRLYAAWVQCKI
jgi:hypothetical protein